MPSVECSLWFPEAGPHDTVRLAAIDAAEWEALAAWAVEPPGRSRCQALSELMGSALPVRLGRAAALRLQEECSRVDWDSLVGLALGGFAALSLVIDQAAGQPGAGLALDHAG